MKKTAFLLLCAVATATTTAFGQAANAPVAKTEAQLIALEKHAWEAWKTRDATWLKANMADEFTLTSAGSTSTKEQYLTTGLKHCQVKSYVNLMGPGCELMPSPDAQNAPSAQAGRFNKPGAKRGCKPAGLQ